MSNARYLAGQWPPAAVTGNGCIVFPQVSGGNGRVARGNGSHGWRRRLIRVIGGIALMASRAAEHYYQDCGDADCMQFGCRAYKTGFKDGYDKGWDEGYWQGWNDKPPEIITVPSGH